MQRHVGRSRRSLLVKGVAFIASAYLVAGCSGQDLTQGVVDSSKQAVQKGVDVSHYQGDLLSKITSTDDIQFVICKATEGVDYIDPKFVKNWSTAKQKGWVRGAYHFYLAADDPTVQAEHFASTVNEFDSNDIAPIVDVEQLSLGGKDVSVSELQSGLIEYLTVLEAKLGRKPMIYTSYNFAQQYLNRAQVFGKYDLWLAEYSGTQAPKIPDAWASKGFKIWQRSDNYKIDSIETDSDVFYGELSEMVK
ncbi:GH25 family lysozyme [Arenicella sp. 4NH20-0111]|uniref:GH25 family lysozyme n=1 Tax=Arenicella sp. 4NH20-0111 TaxID=3127648 RepID=UPI00333F07A3